MDWELTWNHSSDEYEGTSESFAKILNDLILELSQIAPPTRYHSFEDLVAQFTKASVKWPIEKVNGRWIGESYEAILSQGGFGPDCEKNLVLAAAGRIKAARQRGQEHFDDMEEGHKVMLASIMTILLYHRSHLLP